MKIPELNIQLNDFQWFVENYDDIYAKYGVCYVVIKNEKILGTYNNCSTAIYETSKSEQMGMFIVQLCNGDESGYTNYIASNEVCAL